MKKIDMILIIQYLVLFLLFIPAVNAQENIIISRISGRIINITTQQPLIGVNVWLPDTKYGAATDNEGNYTIDNVPIGRYPITANMIGYKQITKTDIVVVPNRSTIINFELRVSPLEISAIDVKSEYFEKDLDDGVTSTISIDNREVSKTPGAPDIFRRLQSVAGVVRASEHPTNLLL